MSRAVLAPQLQIITNLSRHAADCRRVWLPDYSQHAGLSLIMCECRGGWGAINEREILVVLESCRSSRLVGIVRYERKLGSGRCGAAGEACCARRAKEQGQGPQARTAWAQLSSALCGHRDRRQQCASSARGKYRRA